MNTEKLERVVFIGPDPRSPEYDLEYFRSRLAHHGIDVTVLMAETPQYLELKKLDLTTPTNRELHEALEKLMESTPIPCQGDLEPTPIQKLHEQRKERLVKHLGKKRARWS